MSTTDILRVRCTGCQTGFKLKSVAIGKKVKCPKCQTVFRANPITSGEPVRSVPVNAVPDQGEIVAAEIARPSVPPGTKRCDVCHEFVAVAEFDEHYKEHQGKRDDGQYSSYPSLPPEEQWKGDLSKVPQNYVHAKCGAVTGMPKEIIRTYLANPYFYGYSSFCCGCQSHVSGKELTWVDTGETLFDYTKRLQASNPNSKKYRNKLLMTFGVLSLIGGAVIGLILAAIAFFTIGTLVAALAFVGGGILGAAGSFGALYAMRGGI